MNFKVPGFGTKTISMRELPKWEKRRWRFQRQVATTACEIRKDYTQWERFEIGMRIFFQRARFSDVIEASDDFHYTDLGPQVDVCGGVDKHFIVIDCAQSSRRKPISLKAKIRENHAKRERIFRSLQRKKPGRYDHIAMGVCVDGIEPAPPDQRESDHLRIPILDAEFFKKCSSYIDTFGSTLKYQVLKRMGVSGIRIQAAEGKKDFEFPAIAIRSGERVFFSFCADPDKLLKLCYVRRLDRFAESGYQRELNHRKLRNINTFLASNGYFANNLVVCFNGEGSSLRFYDSRGRKIATPVQGQVGVLRVKPEYCSAEIIDGQHRLYGYLDATGDPEIGSQLEVRRKEDALNVVAIEDPGEEERPLLFVDINCNQTRVSMRNIWALMGKIRPASEMGFIANLIIALNGRGPLRGKIHIPGKNVAQGRAINIANLGKGIKDRRLVSERKKDQKLSWNLYEPSATGEGYPEHPSRRTIRASNMFLSVLRATAAQDWKRQEKGFVLTNNGLNVLLRVFAELLKHFHQRGIRYRRGTLKKWLGMEVGKFIESHTARNLRGRASSEDGRARIARDLWKVVVERNSV